LSTADTAVKNVVGIMIKLMEKHKI